MVQLNVTSTINKAGKGNQRVASARNLTTSLHLKSKWGELNGRKD